jgi:hypothetical protein
MYSWLNRHLQLGFEEPIVEEAYTRLEATDLTVWDQQHPRPEGGPQLERKLLQWWTRDTQDQLDAMLPQDPAGMQSYRQIVGQAVETLIGRRLPHKGSLQLKTVSQTQHTGYRQIAGLITHRIAGPATIPFSNAGLDAQVQEQIPVIALIPEQAQSRVCVWVSPQGKSALLDAAGQPIEPVRKLLDHGLVVCGADLFMQGEFLADGQQPQRTRRVDNGRQAAAYTFGYNHTWFAHRVHDLLTVIGALQAYESPPDQIDLVSVDGAGPWVAAARAIAGPAVKRAVIQTGGFRFAQVNDLHDPQFLPGGARYHDLPGMLALAAPAALWLHGEGDSPPRPLQAAYQALGQPKQLTLSSAEDPVPAAVQWLLAQ